MKFCITWILHKKNSGTLLQVSALKAMTLIYPCFGYLSHWCVQKMNIVRIDPGTSLLTLISCELAHRAFPIPPRWPVCQPARLAASHFTLICECEFLSSINILFWIISKWAFYSAAGTKRALSSILCLSWYCQTACYSLSGSLRWKKALYGFTWLC